MLTKHIDIEIPADKPFVHDKLQRIKMAENLTRLVQSTNQPFVISIEAPWGCGKTTFIKMWKAQLESLGHTCLYFNAWENDFVDDPLIAFIGEISKALEDKKGTRKISTQLEKLQKIGGKIVRRALPLTIQIATHGLLTQDSVKKASEIISTSGDEIAGFASEIAEEKIKQYENDKNGIIEFKKELAKFAKLVSDDERQKPPLVFFIDELDRCRPDFSILLLERIKHIFSVEGIVFVLSIDREQIEQSIKTLYGQGMKSDGYLRRFIDFRLRLQKISTKNFCDFLFERFHMAEALKGRRDTIDDQDTLIRVFTALADSYQLSLRVVEQCFTEINLIFRTTTEKTHLLPDVLAILVTLRAHKPDIYIKLQSKPNHSQIIELVKDFQKDLDMTDPFCKTIAAIFEANLIYSNLEEGVINAIKHENSKIAGNNLSAKEEKEYASRLLRIMEGFDSSERYSHSIEFLSSRLDAITDIIA